jgi:hypothetical protein
MSLAVIGAGLLRTGTTSLKAAVEILGFAPCYHGEDSEAPQAWPLWERALDHKTVDWDEIFDGFAATTDVPGCLFYDELAKHYPSAKVVLTIREPNTWFDSVQALLSPAFFAAHRDFPSGPLVGKKFARALGDKLDDRAAVIAAYARHNAAVCRAIPADRLLVYEVTQGWTPLCEFLGVLIPDTPFPNANARSTLPDGPEPIRDFLKRLHAGHQMKPGTNASEAVEPDSNK